MITIACGPVRRRDGRADGERQWRVLLIAALLVGVALRAWQADIQILLDDEWHAVHKLLRSDALDIATHLGYADYSIPLTLYYQALQRTIGLSEWDMHVPSLLAGIALLLVGPRLLARHCPLPVRAIWTSLVAVSPLLVYHSKIARPYALTSVLTFVAILSFQAWWLDRRRGQASLYVAATALAGWLHPITLPFTLLPIAYAGARALVASDRRLLRRVALLGVATAMPLVAALGPALVNDWTEFALKAGRDSVTVASAYRTLLMLAGTGSPFLAVPLLLAAAAGSVQLVRRTPDFALFVASTAGVGSVVVASSGAEWVSHPLVLARYLLPALPFLLLLAAEGLAAGLQAISAGRAGVAVAAGLTAAAVFAGPIPGEWHYPNQFWGHLRYQFDYDPAHNPYVSQVPSRPAPAFYRSLGERPPGTVTIVEAPWRLESHFNALSLYQDTHRQRVKIGIVTPLCGIHDFGEFAEGREGMRMRWMTHLTAVLRGSFGDADYLIVHPRPADVAADPGPAWPDITGCIGAIEARLGPPVFRDDRIVAFALGPARR